MTLVRMMASRRQTSTYAVFRDDYPAAAADDWAVFWESNNETTTLDAVDGYSEPSEIADTWFAITNEAVVNLRENK